MAKSIDDLQTSVSNTGWSNPSFEASDAKFAAADWRKSLCGMISKVLTRDVMQFSCRKKEMPQDHILGSLCKMRIRGFEELRTVLTLHDQDIYQKDSLPSHQNLKKHGRKSSRIRKMPNRNFEARNERAVTGTLAQSNTEEKSVSGEVAFYAKRKASVPRRYLAASASTNANVEKATLSVTPLARHQPHRSSPT